MPETVEEYLQQKEWIAFWLVVLSAALYLKGGAAALQSSGGLVLLLDLSGLVRRRHSHGDQI